MVNKLSFRLDALESAAQTAPNVMNDSPEMEARREKARQRLAERIEEYRTGVKTWERLDPLGRIRYFQEKISDAEADIVLGEEGVGYTPSVAQKIRREMHKLTLRIEPKLRNSRYMFGLLSAQIDRLVELEYDGAKVTQWRNILEPYRGKPDEWNPDLLQLPADALALLKQRKALK
jgi:hypothetical protein